MERLPRLGIALTIIYLVLLAVIAACNWESFSNLQPNAWGDFLAGSLGLLALFWLILGYFQQGAELQNSVQALKRQSEEMAAAVVQQRELVKSNEEAARLETERFLGTLELEATKRQTKMRLHAKALPSLLERYNSANEAHIAFNQGIRSGRMQELRDEVEALKQKIQGLTNSSEALQDLVIPKNQSELLNIIRVLFRIENELFEIRQYLEDSVKLVREERRSSILARTLAKEKE
jgi:hypothetical protein